MDRKAPFESSRARKTGQVGSRLDVDLIHNEIFVPTSTSILVYPREANGDAAPIRNH